MRSYVYVIVEDGTDIDWARSRVVEYLQGIRARLPGGSNPTIGPDATGVGWVFQYALVDDTGRRNLAELRSVQDWFLRYALASVDGVAEVVSIGGFVKQYQVSLDPTKLAAYDKSVKDVVDASRASNHEVEGRLLEFSGREYMVRGRGYLTSPEDIAAVSLGADPRGTPVRVSQGYFTEIEIDREAIARYGITIADVQDVIQSALGGENVTQTVEGRERYPVNVRYARDFREDIPSLERVLVRAPSGANVPLGQLARITLTTGPAMVRDEDGQLVGYVYVDTATSDIGGDVDAARAAVARELRLPTGYTLQWTGQYEFQVRARERLQIIIPIVLFIIFMLLYTTFRSAAEASIVMLSVVYAMTGGVILQWLLEYNFSVAVWVGYIALYGVAVQTGVVMVVYLHEALDRRLRAGGELTGQDVLRATIDGSVLRLRPTLMTVTVVMASLVPVMWSSGAGSDVMKPIAAPIIGGMVTLTVHVLIVTPLIFYLMKMRALKRGRLVASTMVANAHHA